MRWVKGARVQSLWDGYGELFRARLEDGTPVVVKSVRPPTERHHPRGWSSDAGHARKLRSYAVEQAFYRDWAPKLPEETRVARCLHLAREGDDFELVLEDLDAVGFSERRRDVRPPEARACLRWLARFHARFMGSTPDGLWPVGTYWHLATRQEELAATEDEALAAAAPALDARLSGCTYPTLVHGDAKLANFCFAPEGRVAAVDFQYVGGGCGMKDVAYFLSSLLDFEAMSTESEGYLDVYFETLRAALDGSSFDLDAVEAEGRALYPWAWADFHRFLAGWAPDHWKLHDYARRHTRAVLDALGL